MSLGSLLDAVTKRFSTDVELVEVLLSKIVVLFHSSSYCKSVIVDNVSICNYVSTIDLTQTFQIVSTQLKQLQREQEEKNQGLAARALEQAIERTEANIDWVKLNKQLVKDWFTGEL